ncbi:MAG: hypothetical protein ACRCVJ_16520 [Clostridium sp.]|uniref:hypothetical protein n=1 Tax=Clostridium sp. TaxID=1506 RepID=UPI003F303F61
MALLTDATFKKDFIELMNRYGKDYLLITDNFYLVGLQNDSESVKKEIKRFLDRKDNAIPTKPDMAECHKSSGLFI